MKSLSLKVFNLEFHGLVLEYVFHCLGIVIKFDLIAFSVIKNIGDLV